MPVVPGGGGAPPGSLMLAADASRHAANRRTSTTRVMNTSPLVTLIKRDRRIRPAITLAAAGTVRL
ncbi:hypothetical protein GCM10010177_18580 [Actinomadura citrea]|nr:hypothetical protein GCM10010177_18580 [Actinomadura citrea]